MCVERCVKSQDVCNLLQVEINGGGCLWGGGEGWREEEGKPGKTLRMNESEKGCIGHYNTILSFFSLQF